MTEKKEKEFEGVFQFGQSKVHMKLEKGSQLKVRVGSQYMDITDFIDKYSESESQKSERKVMINRFKDKLVQQKTQKEHIVKKKNISPVKNNKKSP